MSFMSFVKKQFIDIIQWVEDDDELLSWRFPTADMEIQYGASLTVRESQAAVFVNEGKIADIFGPGTYKLTTSTLPVLTYLKNWDKLFESPFKSEVYFISTRARLGRKWGTPQAITVRDKDFGAAQIRAFGQFSYHVADVKQFYSTVVGTRESYAISEIEEQLRGAVVSAMASAVGNSGIPFLDLAANQTVLGNLSRDAAAPSFTGLGLALDGFQLVSLTLPDALQKALDTRISMGMIGDLSKYTQLKTAEAIPLLAANEGAGGMAAATAQMAMGVSLGQMAAQGLRTTSEPSTAPANGAGPQAKLAELKGMLDNGLITQGDFDQAKQAILAKLTA